MPDLDLTANLRAVCGPALGRLHPVVLGDEDRHADAQLLGLACARLEAMGARGPALEFVTASLDLLEAITDARSDDESIRALAHASDAWDAAAAAWSAWEQVERGAGVAS